MKFPSISGIRSKFLIVKWYLNAPQRLIRSWLDRRWKPYKRINISTLFESISIKKNIFFVQIGANDGLTNDKLRHYIEKYYWRGILIEPVPHVFDRLKKNYSDQTGLVFENCAISDKSGQMTFYSLRQFDWEGKNLFDDFTEYKIDQLGSFDKKTVLKHSYMHPDFESLIEEIKVDCLSVNDLLQKHTIKAVDVFLIDTEGYDHKIIQSINFKSIRPTVIIFEHQHLSKVDYKKVINLLNVYYDLKVDGWDTVGVLKSNFIL